MNQEKLDKLSVIQQILPHRPPFLFVDNIIEFKAGTSIVTERAVSSQEVFFQGHFPGNPVMPGVLISEALAQTSGLLIGLTLKEKEPAEEDSLAGFVLTTIDMKFLLPVTPGSTLRMSSILKKKFGNLYHFAVAGTVSDRTIARGSLSLGRAT